VKKGVEVGMVVVAMANGGRESYRGEVEEGSRNPRMEEGDWECVGDGGF
jgi:hypothetical protein